ncbi:MAG TPA: hypothetical protein VM223_08195 [Planctomycetota bacterium]|nr:hypothetical protein [Planctomycetota bacterium]
MRPKIAALWAVAAAVAIGTAFADAGRTGKTETIRGTIYTAKDHTGITAVNVIATDGTMYSVLLDKRGVELGDEMANKRVEITGVVTQNGAKIIRVQGWSPLVTGRVEAVKNEAGNITLVKLISPEGTYEVVLDDKGQELGHSMNGRSVDVVGTIRKQKGVTGLQQIVVKDFDERQEPAVKRPEGCE